MIDLQDLATYCSRVSWHGSRYFSCLCPFHEDTSPSLMVYEDGFHCKACRERGSLEKLYRKVSSFRNSSIDTVSLTKNQIPPWKSWTKKYQSWEHLAGVSFNKAQQAPFLLGYVANRGIKKDTILSEMIGWCDRWITLPVFDSGGEMVDLVVRGTSDSQIRYGIRPRIDNDTHLYADWKSIEQSNVVYVCFGIFDRLTLTQCGLPAATGISGKEINSQLLRNLRKQILVIPDFREEQDAMNLVSQLGWRGKILNLNYPEGCKDLNDILMEYGEEKVLEVLNV